MTCRHCRNCRRSCSQHLQKEAGFARRRAMCRGCNFYFVFLFVFSIFCMLVFDFWYLVFVKGKQLGSQRGERSVVAGISYFCIAVFLQLDFVGIWRRATTSFLAQELVRSSLCSHELEMVCRKLFEFSLIPTLRESF